MAPKRSLPSRFNPLMTEEAPAYDVLVARRRLGQTDVSVKTGQMGTSNSTKLGNLGTFDYAHLRAPLPRGIVSGIFKPSPASYFLMRRSYDGYISATGMFKATFPYSEAVEEEMERKYIKTLETTSTDETAGNVWVHPQHALELAEDYQITPWIKALLDIAPIEVSSKDSSPKVIAAPPKFLVPNKHLAEREPAVSHEPIRRSTRSVSPSKIASPKKPIAPMRKSRALKAAKVEAAERSDVSASPEVSTQTLSKNLKNALKEASTEDNTKLSRAPEVKEDVSDSTEESVVRVNVDTDVEVKGDSEITHTHVEVEMPAGCSELPLPADTAAMLAKAREMVEAAVEAKNSRGSAVTRKRKVIEVEEAEEVASTAAAGPAKKVKVETELKKERVKTRALMGLTATLAIGATIQYVFGAF
ncbi:hypothetical protein BJ878DRAFT_216250 [Calycina marina]|uniref:HTH APSES-type domain-containing protein n=1 Tax=Calycina marina TaxID=1763456 RepID=A0A9P7YXR9_9HELO|nr:hypothetical protein BJ878DRAFT_216250 [Calycina marina]